MSAGRSTAEEAEGPSIGFVVLSSRRSPLMLGSVSALPPGFNTDSECLSCISRVSFVAQFARRVLSGAGISLGRTSTVTRRGYGSLWVGKRSCYAVMLSSGSDATKPMGVSQPCLFQHGGFALKRTVS